MTHVVFDVGGSVFPLEKAFSSDSVSRLPEEKIDTIVVSNLVDLGRLTALRFIHWAIRNPAGVVSLPTGKTPQFFIEWVKFYRKNWSSQSSQLLECGFSESEIENGFSFAELKFVQIDEFFPINPTHTNSFKTYIERFYFEEFGIQKKNALMLDPQKDLRTDLDELFPQGYVNHMLQFKDDQSLSPLELRQKVFLLQLSQYCDDYENRIREMGGIGFFLGGIGPDGHIGFNVRGSSHFSTTRLCPVNYETQAASAADLGGIQRDKLVLTIGLKTISAAPDAIAIIMAAGNAKAEVVRQAIELEKHTDRPASVLHDLPNARFYVTPGAASCLEGRALYHLKGMVDVPFSLVHEILCRTALKCEKPIRELKVADLETFRESRILMLRLGISENGQLLPTLERSIAEFEKAVVVGRSLAKDTRSLHTAPHHDDLILGIFPVIKRELEANRCHVSVFTSGFTSVTNAFFLDQIKASRTWLNGALPTFETFCSQGRSADCRTYLEAESTEEPKMRRSAPAARLVREIIAHFALKTWAEVDEKISEIEEIVASSYSGMKDGPDIQVLKGALREYEEELTWTAHGMDVDRISHLRLGFYQGDIFNQDPSESDCERVFSLLEQLKPQRISLALDPEGSGPDTHYKCLLAVSQALSRFVKLFPDQNVEILGYRNVWNRFFPWEAHAILLLSQSQLEEIDETFKRFYFSQVEASFPSPDYNGPFSELSIRIWKEQKRELEVLLGDRNEIAEAKGAILVRMLSPKELIAYAQERRSTTQGL